MTQKYASGAVGSAGELVAQARLLMRGWTVGNVNTGGMMNAPAIDLFAAKGSKTLKIAVKGSGSDCFQWSFPGDWVTERGSIFKGDVRPDFMIFVLFLNADACDVYVVPADVADADVMKQHVHYHSHPKKDGMPRKKAPHVSIWFNGLDSETQIGKNFAEKWAQYKNAWNLLD